MAGWFWPAPDVDADLTDPPLLRDNSTLKSYKTSRFTYPDLRVFYRDHVKADQFPCSLPLLVCVPGLGGSVAQFHPLLSSLADLAPCLSVDWPGGGRSRYVVTDWDAYTTASLVELLEVIIQDHRAPGQSVVLIAHSMGTAVSAWLASKQFDHKTDLADHVVGLVALCPVANPLDEAKTTLFRRLLWVPEFVFVLWRMWDGRGGAESASVTRFVGGAGDEDLRKLQYKFNQQSRSPVWRRMAGGTLPTYQDGKPTGGFPSASVWAALDMPVYLIAGEADKLTTPKEVATIVAAMKGEDHSHGSDVTPMQVSLQAHDHVREARSDSAPERPDDDDDDEPSSPADEAGPRDIPAQPEHPAWVVRSTVLPAPANHTLLYSPRSVRAVAGLISDFLALNVTGQLSLAWQLQFLAKDGKWDVKNLAKWTAVPPVSQPIGPEGVPPVFMVMKTLREVDEVHSPKLLVENHGDQVKDVVDISLDQPVYDPRTLEKGGIHYHKLATMSKIPPTDDDVERFVALVDKLRASQQERAEAEGWDKTKAPLVGVHCHYGFNRSGYMVVCYLVERCGVPLDKAVEIFGEKRPNGIRHSHFLDKLHMRYDLERTA